MVISRRQIVFASAGFALVSVFNWTSWFQNQLLINSPEHIARSFLEKLSKNDAASAVRYFGTAGCKCMPIAGWSAFLQYKSAQEPNFAWLLGQNFSVSSCKVGRQHVDEKKSYIFHRLAQVSLQFPHDKGPLFLPLKMAYGAAMSESELKDFAANPSKDALKGLTLRLRRTLEKGAIESPPGLGAVDRSKSDVKDANEVSKMLTPDIVSDLFGEQMALFLAPKDPGIVTGKDGARVSQNELEKTLPRLETVTLEMHLVRNATDRKWKIMQIHLLKPTVESSANTEIVLLDSTNPEKMLAEGTKKSSAM